MRAEGSHQEGDTDKASACGEGRARHLVRSAEDGTQPPGSSIQLADNEMQLLQTVRVPAGRQKLLFVPL